MECKDFEKSIIQDKERILRLCKRLNKFSLDEITAIVDDVDEAVLELLLLTLVREKKLVRQDETYFYNKKNSISTKTLKLPMMFQYHSRERIDMIIKAFCCECSVEHLSKILNLGVNCVNDFYRFFRETLYSKQIKKLEIQFHKIEQKPFERIFFDKKYSFYNYDNLIYVSDAKLIKDVAESLKYGEQKYFKIIYSRLRRKVSHNTHSYYTHFHLAEHLWRQEKSFEKMYEELNGLFF